MHHCTRIQRRIAAPATPMAVPAAARLVLLAAAAAHWQLPTAAPASWEATPLKVFVLAGQSNCEGQAEVDSAWGRACPEQHPGMAPVCCSQANVSGCCPDRVQRGTLFRCVPHQPGGVRPPNTTMDPCPHDAVQGPTNDACFKNGTLKYMTLDPRTRAEFAQCWDNTTDSWTVLKDVKVWDQEGSGCWESLGKTCAAEDNVTQPFQMCPKGYCNPFRAGGATRCNSSYLLGGCGSWGSLSPHWGAGGATTETPLIGPEYAFGFALHNDGQFKAKDEQVLLIKVSYGGTELMTDWRPPLSVNETGGSVGPDYKAMLRYVRTVLEPQNLALYFADLRPRPSHKILGFAWWQGWNDGGDVIAAGNYEQNLVALIRSVRRDFNNSDLAVSVPVSGFHGWNDSDFRRKEVLAAQFAACDPKRHPEAQPAIAEETRGFWRQSGPSPQVYHFFHNAETYWLTGKAMARGMLDLLLHRPRPSTPPPPPPARCRSSFDCNGANGECTAATGICKCRSGWTGRLCNELVTHSGRVSFSSQAWTGSGSPIRERLPGAGGSDRYHLFVSRIRNQCGIQHRDLNSEISHFTAPNTTGPYGIVPGNGGLALGPSPDAWDNGSPFAPSVHRLPNGTYVMFYQAMLSTSDQPAVPDCGSGNPTASATVGTGDGRRIGIALADRLDGPWRRASTPLFHSSAPPNPNATLCVDEQDPTPIIKADGSVLIMYNCNDWRGKGPMADNATGGRGPQHLLLATAPSVDGPYTHNATHNMLFSPSGAALWIDPHTGIYHGLFGTSIGATPFGAGTHCWSADGLVWYGLQNMPAYTGRMQWAVDMVSPYARAKTSVLASRGLPRLLLDGEPGSSYGQPVLIFTAAEDCVGVGDNETTGNGVSCADAVGPSASDAAAAIGTTKTYSALAEIGALAVPGPAAARSATTDTAHPPALKLDDVNGGQNVTTRPEQAQKRSVYAWVSGNATAQAVSAAQLRNHTWSGIIDGVRGFCGVGWQRGAPGAPWTVAVTSPADLEGCRAARSAAAETGRPFEVVLGGRLPAAALLEDVSAAVASAAVVAKAHNFSGYNVDDESECAPRSTLRNFTTWVQFHDAFAAGLARHGLLLSSEIYATFGVVNAPYLPQRPCTGLHRPGCAGCMDQYRPDPRIGQALSAGTVGSATRWVTMDTYFYTLDHFVDVLDWHRSFLPAGERDRLGVGLINSIAESQPIDGLPLHNVSAEGWAARGHALHAASVEHISIWLMPLSDEFLWWLPRWKDRCEACGLLACWQPTAECGRGRPKTVDDGKDLSQSTLAAATVDEHRPVAKSDDESWPGRSDSSVY